jgi:hypothetical protein
MFFVELYQHLMVTIFMIDIVILKEIRLIISKTGELLYNMMPKITSDV